MSPITHESDDWKSIVEKVEYLSRRVGSVETTLNGIPGDENNIGLVRKVDRVDSKTDTLIGYGRYTMVLLTAIGIIFGIIQGLKK